MIKEISTRFFLSSVYVYYIFTDTKNMDHYKNSCRKIDEARDSGMSSNIIF